MPFTDPMADGPAIQAAGLRALKAGQNMKKTLAMVRAFRKSDDATPIVLMGYYNPIYIYGVDKFLVDAKSAGVDGLIVVDLPPEEDDELCLPALKAGLNFIRLATPTTDDKRLPAVLANTSGFVYYVSITGITGMAAPDTSKVTGAVARIKRHTALPVAVGFGVRTAAQARAIAQGADGVVVGSALIDALKASLDKNSKATKKTVEGGDAIWWRRLRRACGADASRRSSVLSAAASAYCVAPGNAALAFLISAGSAACSRSTICRTLFAAHRLDDLDLAALRLGQELRIAHHVVEGLLQRRYSLRRHVGRSHDRPTDQLLREHELQDVLLLGAARDIEHRRHVGELRMRT